MRKFQEHAYRRYASILLGLVVFMVILGATPRPAHAGFFDAVTSRVTNAVANAAARGASHGLASAVASWPNRVLGEFLYGAFFAQRDTQYAAARLVRMQQEIAEYSAPHSLPSPLSAEDREREGGSLLAQADERTETPPPEKEITRVREVVERREVLVPADLASLREDIEASGLTLRNYVDAGVNGVLARIAALSGRADNHAQMITLTQKIDHLNEITVTNGFTLSSGSLEIAKGNLSLVSGNITLDSGNVTITSGTMTIPSLIVTGAISSQTASSSFTNLTVSGNTTLGDGQTDMVTINGGMMAYGNSSTSTIPNAVNAWSLATSMTATPILSIDSANSRVGIGTTSPGSLLSISGSSGFGLVNTGAGNTFYAYDEANDTTPFVIAADGNVGIGTTTPGSILSVQGGNFQVTGTSTTHALIATSTLFVGGTTGSSMVVLNSGNVGIGTTSPGSILSLGNTGNDTINILTTATSTFGSGINVRTGCFAVNGTCVGGGASTYLGLTDTQSSFTANRIIHTNSAGTALTDTSGFVFDRTNLGIGTTTPGSILSVAGDSYFDSNIISISSSSAASLTVKYLSNATTTIPNNAINVWSIGTSTATVPPVFSVSTSVLGNIGVVGGVGIGIATPSTRLDVRRTDIPASGGQTRGEIAIFGGAGTPTATQGSISLRASPSNGSWPEITFTDTSAKNASLIQCTSVTNCDGFRIAHKSLLNSNFNADGLTFSNGELFGISSTTPWGLFSIESSQSLVGSGVPIFVVGDKGTSTPFLIVDGNQGNVGIGTTSPWGLLSVEMGTADNAFVVSDNGTTSPSFVVKGSGNVGIGTTSPGSLLSVSGSSGFGLVNTGAGNTFYAYDEANDASPFVIDNAGNVGIGTANPAVKLDISHATSPQLNLTMTTNVASSIGTILFRESTGLADRASIVVPGISFNTTSRQVDMELYADNDITFWPANVQGMTISSGGNVGIGTSTPGTPLSVTGGGVFTGPLTFTYFYGTSTTATSSLEGVLSVGSSTPAANALFSVGTSSQLLFVDKSSGNVGIGTANPRGSLHVQGSSVPGANSPNGVYAGISSNNEPRIDLRAANSSAIDIRFARNVGSDFDGRISYGRTGVDVMEFATAQVGNRMVINASGNVGIGTTSPGSLLSVQGVGNFVSGVSATSTLYSDLTLRSLNATSTIYLSDGSTLVPALAFANDTDTGILLPAANTFQFVSGGGSRMVVGAGISMGTLDATPDATLEIVVSGGTDSFNISSAAVNDGDLVTILSGGNVGIGTTNPQQVLTVIGNGLFSGDLALNGNDISLGTGTATSTISGGFGIGIGTTTPGAAFAIATSTAGLNTAMLLSNLGSGYTFWAQDEENDATPFVIDNAGNVGIGTTSPSQLLSAHGNALISGTSTVHGLFATSTVRAEGKLILPGLSTSGTGNALCLNGSNEVTKSGANDCTVSSVRYKTNVKDLDLGLDTLMKFSPRTFTYLHDGREAMGFIAEEVEEIDPRLVVYDEEGRVTSFRYNEFTALITKSIQELSKKLDDNLAMLAKSGGTPPTTNAWAVDQQSGKVNVSFFGNINMQGNAILDVGKITGYLGKWSIDEEGKLIVQDLEVKGKVKIGTPENPQGITLYDKTTADAYCMYVDQGAIRAVKGLCEDSSSTPPPPPPPAETPTESSSLVPESSSDDSESASVLLPLLGSPLLSEEAPSIPESASETNEDAPQSASISPENQ